MRWKTVRTYGKILATPLQALGRVPETSTVEPALPSATLTAPTSPTRECIPTPVLDSEVFEEEVSNIAQVHCENDLFEFELTDHPPLENVKGNLRRKLQFWKRIGTPKFILNVIERGYMLPFLSLPEPAVFRNNRSSLAHAKFVEDAIRELVESGRVIEVVVPPLVVNPLSVSIQATGKKRLILDLRYVNKCLRKMRVKYEDWKVALSYFMTEAFMFSFDLKSGYHHIEIFEGHQTYLCFSWRHGSSNFTKFYVFTVLPFGLSSAPHIFTKTLKPLEKHWRHQGICIAIFLDDGWAIERDRQVCSSVSKAVKADLGEAGFITNDEKSIWEPCQRIDWLGLTWDSALGTIEIVDRRCAKILATIDSIVDSGFVISARNLASFTGQIISTSPVSGSISRIMTRHCVLSTLSVQHWEDKIELDQYCIEELRFWRANLNSLKARDCFLIHKPQRFVYSDASATGCGSVFTLNEEHICHRLWEPSECSKSSTWRELAAIDFSLESFAPVLEGSLVKWFTDSQSAAKIVEVGSMKLDLHRLAVKIFQFCAEHRPVARIFYGWVRSVDYTDQRAPEALFTRGVRGHAPPGNFEN